MDITNVGLYHQALLKLEGELERNKQEHFTETRVLQAEARYKVTSCRIDGLPLSRKPALPFSDSQDILGAGWVPCWTQSLYRCC